MNSQPGRHHLLNGYHGGWHLSPPDERDRVADTTGLGLPDRVDPRGHPCYPEIWNQLNLGCCTAEGVTACLQWDLGLDLGRKARRRSILDTYWQERSQEGSPLDQDTGAYGRTGFYVAQHVGLLLEHAWPFVDPDYQTGFVGPPPTTGPRGGVLDRQHLRKPYVHPTTSREEHMRILANNQFIAYGFQVNESFFDTGADGVVPLPKGRVVGGHEVDEIGYLPEYPDHVLCRNSWGTDWGLGGHFLMPWQVVLDPNIAGDHRTIVRAT